MEVTRWGPASWASSRATLVQELHHTGLLSPWSALGPAGWTCVRWPWDDSPLCVEKPAGPKGPMSRCVS